MVNLRKLLDKICQTLNTFTAWASSTEDTITWFISKRGTRVSSAVSSTTTPSSVSVATSTYTNICSLTLNSGRYFIWGRVRFASNATGRRYIYISDESQTDSTQAVSRNAVSGTYTSLLISYVTNVSDATEQRYLVAWQNSGSSLSVSAAAFQAVKISQLFTDITS